jgi:type VI secretion system protein ImpK
MNLDVSKTLGGPRDLSGLCTDLFLIIIRMREAEDLGEPAALRKLVTHYMDLLEKNCGAIGADPESVHQVKYALTALIDETVLSVPGACRDYWFTRPLQLDYFGDNIAGEEFYKKLAKLADRPESRKDVLEVYYLCLSLGFEGKYRISNAEERTGVIEELGRKLRRTRIRSSSGLSPHGRRSEEGGPKKRAGTAPYPLWVAGVVGVGLAAATWAILQAVNAAQVRRVLEVIAR